MSFLDALYSFTLKFQNLQEIDYSEKTLVFITASGLVGLLMILLDIAAFYLRKKSFLDMHYNANTKYFWVIISWTFACTVVGYLGLIMDIFNTTIQSCALVGGSWIYLASRIANNESEPEAIQE